VDKRKGKEESNMKQIIVMVAMIALGIAVAGFVMGFGTTADALVQAAKAKITYSQIAGN
jgi:flagellar basal body-associated protein FliL